MKFLTAQKIADYFGVTIDALMGDNLLWLIAKNNGQETTMKAMEEAIADDALRKIAKEKAPAQEGERMDLDGVQAAFFHGVGGGDLTEAEKDELWADVTAYAKFKLNQRGKLKQQTEEDA